MESIAIHFNIHPLNLLIISGIIQLFIVGGVLLFQRRSEQTASRLMAAVMIVSALHFSWYMILDTNLDQIAGAQLLRFWFSFPLAIGPLLYLYTNILTTQDFKVGKGQLVHFIPAGIGFALQLVLAVYSTKTGQHVYQLPEYVYFKVFELVCTGASIVFYLKRSLPLIRTYETSLSDYYSDHSHMTLSWLNGLIRYLRVLWIFWIVFEVCFIVFWHFQLHYIVVYVLLYVLMIVITYSTYWIGLKAFQAVGSLSEKRFSTTIKQPASNFYAKTQTAEIQRIIERLQTVMNDDKLYRDENLSLQTLAEKMNENPNLVSYVLNNSLGQTFYDFVNKHRVEEVKLKMKDPKYAHLKLIEVAFECGFNSKATFNRAFKRVTGVSPTIHRASEKS